MIFPNKYLEFDLALPEFHVWAFIIEILELLIEEKKICHPVKACSDATSV